MRKNISTNSMKENIVYKKIGVSLNRYRRQEMRMTDLRKNLPFSVLFEHRINKIGGRRVRVSITVFFFN